MLVRKAMGEMPPAIIAATTISVAERTRKSPDGFKPANPAPADTTNTMRKNETMASKSITKNETILTTRFPKNVPSFFIWITFSFMVWISSKLIINIVYHSMNAKLTVLTTHRFITVGKYCLVISSMYLWSARTFVMCTYDSIQSSFNNWTLISEIIFSHMIEHLKNWPNRLICRINNTRLAMKVTPEHNERMAKMTFSSVYPHYVTKIERKGRTVLELHQVIEWLTGFDSDDLHKLLEENVTFETFFNKATLNPNAKLITGVICGYRIEDIDNTLTRQVRYLDKLVDELAKGRKMDKILRSGN